MLQNHALPHRKGPIQNAMEPVPRHRYKLRRGGNSARVKVLLNCYRAHTISLPGYGQGHAVVRKNRPGQSFHKILLSEQADFFVTELLGDPVDRNQEHAVDHGVEQAYRRAIGEVGGSAHADLIHVGGDDFGGRKVQVGLQQIGFSKPTLITLPQRMMSIMQTVGRMAGRSTCKIRWKRFAPSI